MILRSAMVMAMALIPEIVRAQTVEIGLSDSVVVAEPPRTSVRLPIVVSMGSKSGVNLAAFQATVSWPAAQLRFDSLRTAGGTGLSLTTNPARASEGSLIFNAYAPRGLVASTTLGHAYFTPSQSGVASLTVRVDVAGDEMGRSILEHVRGRTINVCINDRSAAFGCRPVGSTPRL